ncbi:MAG: ribonuclease HI family protein [Candidatus Berkelbacteria bacterium]
MITIFTDGGSRGNPGPAAIGGVVYDDIDREIHAFKKCIGTATNNEAEYGAIIEALDYAVQYCQNNTVDKILCKLDSKLVVEQMCGRYKIKQQHISDLVMKARGLLNQIEPEVSFVHIPREQNKRADELVNQALDAA